MLIDLEVNEGMQLPMLLITPGTSFVRRPSLLFCVCFVMLKYIRADLSFYLLQDTCWFSVVGVPFSSPAFTTLKTPVDGHRLGAPNFSHAS